MASDKMADDDIRPVCHRNDVTSSSNASSPYTSVQFIAPVAALVALNLIVIVGNSLVIAAVFTYRKLRTVTNTFIVSLAVSDLLLGVVVLPYSSVNEVLGWWPFGRIWCSAWLAIDVWVCTASILNLCAISLDRYLAISRPFKYPMLMSPTRAKVAVAVVWTLALAICLPPLLGWRDSEVATTKHPCDVINIDRSVDHIVKTTIDSKTGNRSLRQVSTIDDIRWTAGTRSSDTYGIIETNARHSTTNFAVMPKRSIATQLPFLILSRVTNAIKNKREKEFVRNFTASSTADIGTHAGEKRGRISRRSELSTECVDVKNRKTVDRNLVTDLPIEANASFSTCQATSNAPRPMCMLTSEPGYIIYSACGSFWIPMLVMVFFYLKIYRTAVKATTALNSGVLTKKTGRIASSSEVDAVNLRVHRGGGGVRTSAGHWTSSPNLQSKSVTHRTSEYRGNVDSKRRRIHGVSTPDGDCFRQPSTGISRDPTVICSFDAHAADESGRHSSTNGSTGCCTCSKNKPRIGLLSRRGNHVESTGEINAMSVSNRRTCLSTAANIDATPRRRRINSRLTSDSDVVVATPVPEEGVESLVQSTLTPILEQCSSGDQRASDNAELVDASQAHARRRFVQIRTQLRRLNREKKAAKTVGVIVGCFVLCWAPFFTVYVLGVFCADCTPPVAFVVFFWLGYCNSAINPFVYALCSKDFRFAFRCLLRCGRGSQQYSDPTIAALVTRLRSAAPRVGSESVNTAIRLSAVSRQ